jgi:hypothetical protein
MAGFSATADVTELIPEITLGVDYIYQAESLGRSICNYRDVSGMPGNVVEFPIYTEITASTSVAETSTPGSHQLNLSMASLTLAKRSVYVGLGDLAAASMTDPQSVGRYMGKAMIKAIDASIFGVVTTTNYATSAGSTDQTMTLTYVLNGINLLEVNEVSLPLNIVLAPVQFKGIRLGLTPVANDDTVTGALPDTIGADGVVSRAFGCNWYVSPRVGTRTVDSTASCNSGLIYDQQAIGFGFKWMYEKGVEGIRSDEALTKLLLNWADSAGIVNASGVCTIYTTTTG